MALIDPFSASAAAAADNGTTNASSSGTASGASSASSDSPQDAVIALMSQLGSSNTAGATDQSAANGLLSLISNGLGSTFGTDGLPGNSEDPLMSLTAGNGAGLASNSSGSTVQDAVLALLQAGQTNSPSSGTSGSGSTSTSNSGALDFTSVVALYQSQFDQQLQSTLNSGTSAII